MALLQISEPDSREQTGTKELKAVIGLWKANSIGDDILVKDNDDKIKLYLKEKSRIYVLISDGECNEGSVWEAVLCASHFKLDNLFFRKSKTSR